MKCLSLWQPWASLLVHSRKRVETRSWPIRHRGPLLIHAAKKWNHELEWMCLANPFRSALESAGVTMMDSPHWRVQPGDLVVGLPFGAIVGLVTVKECFPTERVNLPNADCGLGVSGGVLTIGATERAFGDYSPGRFAFLCVEPVAFAKPIPFRGMQGMFDVSDHLIPAAPGEEMR